MTGTLDELDIGIVNALLQNPRAKAADLAAELGADAATIRQRIEVLIDSSTLQISAILDPAAVGMHTVAMIGINADLDRIEEIAARVASLPEVRYVSIATGAYDIITEVVFPSNEKLLDFLMGTIAAIDGIKRTETALVLKSVKASHQWRPRL